MWASFVCSILNSHTLSPHEITFNETGLWLEKKFGKTKELSLNFICSNFDMNVDALCCLQHRKNIQ